MNTTNNFSADLSPTVATLATMADLCVKILEHIANDRIREVFPLSDELRSVRARLSDLIANRLEALKHFKPSTAFEYRQLEQLKLGIGIVAKFDQFHNQWVNTIIEPTEEELADATVEQWHISLEKRFPQGWDGKKDLLVVYGSVPENLQKALQERMQERVLVYLPKHPTNEDPKDEISETSTEILGKQSTNAKLKGNFATAHQIEDLKKLFPLKDAPNMVSELTALYPPNADELKNIQQELQALYLIGTVSRNTTKSFGPRWFKQGLKNIPAIARSQPLIDLNGLFRGLPIIIISPGPSLETNIIHLKRAEGKALIMAPAQSMKRLHQELIYPDFIVVIDPQDLTSDPFEFIDPTMIRPNQALIVGASCHPNVISAPFKRKYFFGSEANSSWITDFFNDDNVNTSGTSVSVAATNIAINWGCHPIVLVGQDLAYKDGIQYAGPTNSRKNDGIFELDGYHGGRVKTPYGYKVAHYEFELIAERLSTANSPIELINATEGGAKIKGFIQIPLKTVIENRFETSRTVNEVIQDAQQKSVSFDYEQRISIGKTRVKQVIDIVAKLKESSLKCKTICKKLQTKRTQRDLLRLDKEEKKMRNYLKKLGFLELVVHEEINQITTILKTQSSFDSNLEISNRFFDTILQACDLTINGISDDF